MTSIQRDGFLVEITLRDGCPFFVDVCIGGLNYTLYLSIKPLIKFNGKKIRYLPSNVLSDLVTFFESAQSLNKKKKKINQ